MACFNHVKIFEETDVAYRKDLSKLKNSEGKFLWKNTACWQVLINL